jgi:Zn-dependent peptidase ImmA (M78 family)
MAVRVPVAPSVLAWATERSGIDRDELRRKFPKLSEWASGGSMPTMKQLETFAEATYTPFGYLLLPTPPNEQLPVPDFRTIRDQGVRRPSANLLDTIAVCEQRQEWYRQWALAAGEPSIPYIGSVSLADDVEDVADQMRDVLGFDLNRRRDFPTWTDALSGLSEHAEDAGVLVMISGVVGSNTHRKLNPDEFRAFALVDDYAPVIFINGVDAKAAQIFTLAHELVHLWLGESAVSNPQMVGENGNETERWCNEVAAELLVPRRSLEREVGRATELGEEVQRLARFYKVSSLVVLRRMHDIGALDWDAYRVAFEDHQARFAATVSTSDGGNWYFTQPVRTSKRFARTILADTIEGRTPYREAFRLLGFTKFSTFEGLAERMGVA